MNLPILAAPMVLDVRDAATPGAVALGSAPIPPGEASDGEARVTVQVSRKPGTVRVGLYVDVPPTGGGGEDLRRESGDLSTAGATVAVDLR